MGFAERKLCAVGVLLEVAPIETAGKQTRCPPYRHQPTGSCLEATNLHRYVLASCMDPPAWLERVSNTLSKSDVNGTRGSMPSILAMVAYTQDNKLSKAPTFIQISRNADIATVAALQTAVEAVTDIPRQPSTFRNPNSIIQDTQ